eukprot:c20786_g1_i8.p1 GENE.c20786_g1_i8~~c20786_g1_i8.p1  ORF type:complete len:258 (+),score=12.39 c20786_g1_i8:275-1048(+)
MLDHRANVVTPPPANGRRAHSALDLEPDETGDGAPPPWSYISQRARARMRMTAREIEASAMIQLQRIWDRKNREALELWDSTHVNVHSEPKQVHTGSGATWHRRIHRVSKPTVSQMRERATTMSDLIEPRKLNSIDGGAWLSGDLASPADASAQSEALRALDLGHHADPIIEITSVLALKMEHVVDAAMVRTRSIHRSRALLRNTPNSSVASLGSRSGSLLARDLSSSSMTNRRAGLASDSGAALGVIDEVFGSSTQ